jgi:hypothetical protein
VLDLPCDDVLTSCVLAVPVLGRPQSHRVQDRRPARRPALAEHVVQRCVTTAMLRGPAQPDQGFHRVPRRTAAHRTVPAAHRPAGQGTAGRGSPAAAAGPQPPLHRQRRCLGPHRAARPLPIPRSLATPKDHAVAAPRSVRTSRPGWAGVTARPGPAHEAPHTDHFPLRRRCVSNDGPRKTRTMLSNSGSPNGPGRQRCGRRPPPPGARDPCGSVLPVLSRRTAGHQRRRSASWC